MLYLAIPAQNEVATIGVLLWRLRTVLAEFPREYEVVVYDDASTDETAAVAEQYQHAMPVTVLRGAKPIGYAGAVDALVRHVANHTRYPRRDAMLLLQGDFTDPPGIVPEFARRFEGGADLVVGERTAVVDAPTPVRRLFAASGWALRPFVRVDGVRDLTGSMRLMRISALRDLLRTVGDAPVCEGDSWTANADLLLKLIPHARRVESVPLEPTYGVRTRATRRLTMRDTLAALRWGWRSRGRRAELSVTADGTVETVPKHARVGAPQRRRDEGELTVDRLRERSREREKLRGDVAETEAPRGRRESRRDERPERKVDRKPERSSERSAERTSERVARDVARANPKEPRDGARESEKSSTRSQAATPAPMRARPSAVIIDAETVLNDPFAAPSSRTSAPRVREDAVGAQSPQAAPLMPPTALERALREAAAASARQAEAAQPSDEPVADELTSEIAADDNTDGADARERKRRRNRRSRRRRSKTRGAADAGASADATASDGADYADGSDDGDVTSAPTRGPRDIGAATDEARPADASQDTNADDSDSDEASADADAGDGSDEASASRARRRGRRGRRGGSRRSRGRHREGGASGENSSGDGGPTTDGSSNSDGSETAH